MVKLIPLCVAAMVTGDGLVVLAVCFIGWLYWLHLREKQEETSPERQRERLRRDYWKQVKT
jgi:hypothetical protein